MNTFERSGNKIHLRLFSDSRFKLPSKIIWGKTKIFVLLYLDFEQGDNRLDYWYWVSNEVSLH